LKKRPSARIKTKSIIAGRKIEAQSSLFIQPANYFYNNAHLKRTKTTMKNSEPITVFL